EGGLSWLDQFYGKSLRSALARRKTVIVGAIGVFVASLALTPLVGTEFMPQTDSGWVTVSAEVQTGRSLEYTADVVRRMEERVVDEIPELEMVNSTAGAGGMSFG